VHGYHGRVNTPAALSTVERLRDGMPEPPLLTWAVTLGIGLLAFLLRLIGVADPPRLIFDETYYAKDAWSLLQSGYERTWASDANAMIIAGDLSGLTDEASFIVHPPVGKWLIASGQAVFGMTPFGWRIAAVVFGALLVVATVRLAHRVSRSLLIGALAGVLLTFDGLAFAMSRVALLDIFQATFLVAAVAALVADRDHHRHKLADAIEASGRLTLGGAFGPLLWWRPWRWTAGVLFGLAIATKWGAPSIYSTGPQGFSETLYAYVSQGGNNGSAFAGYTGFLQPNGDNVGAFGITFANLAGAAAMMAGRYIPILAVLAIGGAMVGRRVAPEGAGTFRTDTPTFMVLLIGVVLLVALLTFVPALLLGPVVQALSDGTFQ